MQYVLYRDYGVHLSLAFKRDHMIHSKKSCQPSVSALSQSFSADSNFVTMKEKSNEKTSTCGISNHSGVSCHVGCILQLIYHGMPDIRNDIVHLSGVCQRLDMNKSVDNLKGESTGGNAFNYHNQSFIVELGKLFQGMSYPGSSDTVQRREEHEKVKNNCESNTLQYKKIHSVDPSPFYNTFSIENGPIKALDTDKMGDAVISLQMILQHLFHLVDIFLHCQTEVHICNSDSDLQQAWQKLKNTLYQQLNGKLVKSIIGIPMTFDSESDESDSDSSLQSEEYAERTSMKDFYNPILLPVLGHSTLESSIQKYVSPRLLKEYQWSTESPTISTNHQYRTTQSTSFLASHMPQHILLQLERFRFNPKNFTVEKVLDDIDIPLVLNMKEYSTRYETESDSSFQSDAANNHANRGIIQNCRDKNNEEYMNCYHLTGIVLHDGKTADDGHYLTLVKQNPQHSLKHEYSNHSEICLWGGSDWLLCNDEHVLHLVPPERKTTSNMDEDEREILSLPLTEWIFKERIKCDDDNFSYEMQDHLLPFHPYEMILLYTQDKCSHDYPCIRCQGGRVRLDDSDSETNEDESNYDSSTSDTSTSYEN